MADDYNYKVGVSVDDGSLDALEKRLAEPKKITLSVENQELVKQVNTAINSVISSLKSKRPIDLGEIIQVKDFTANIRATNKALAGYKTAVQDVISTIQSMSGASVGDEQLAKISKIYETMQDFYSKMESVKIDLGGSKLSAEAKQIKADLDSAKKSMLDLQKTKTGKLKAGMADELSAIQRMTTAYAKMEQSKAAGGKLGKSDFGFLHAANQLKLYRVDIESEFEKIKKASAGASDPMADYERLSLKAKESSSPDANTYRNEIKEIDEFLEKERTLESQINDLQAKLSSVSTSNNSFSETISGLESVTKKAAEATEAIEKLNQLKRNSQDSISDASKVKDVGTETGSISTETISTEQGSLSSVLETVGQITQAVREKTQAFREEGAVVSGVANVETDALGKVVNSIGKIKSEINSIDKDSLSMASGISAGASKTTNRTSNPSRQKATSQKIPRNLLFDTKGNPLDSKVAELENSENKINGYSEKISELKNKLSELKTTYSGLEKLSGTAFDSGVASAKELRETILKMSSDLSKAKWDTPIKKPSEELKAASDETIKAQKNMLNSRLSLKKLEIGKNKSSNQIDVAKKQFEESKKILAQSDEKFNVIASTSAVKDDVLTAEIIKKKQEMFATTAKTYRDEMEKLVARDRDAQNVIKQKRTADLVSDKRGVTWDTKIEKLDSDGKIEGYSQKLTELKSKIEELNNVSIGKDVLNEQEFESAIKLANSLKVEISELYSDLSKPKWNVSKQKPSNELKAASDEVIKAHQTMANSGLNLKKLELNKNQNPNQIEAAKKLFEESREFYKQSNDSFNSIASSDKFRDDIASADILKKKIDGITSSAKLYQNEMSKLSAKSQDMEAVNRQKRLKDLVSDNRGISWSSKVDGLGLDGKLDGYSAKLADLKSKIDQLNKVSIGKDVLNEQEFESAAASANKLKNEISELYSDLSKSKWNNDNGARLVGTNLGVDEAVTQMKASIVAMNGIDKTSIRFKENLNSASGDILTMTYRIKDHNGAVRSMKSVYNDTTGAIKTFATSEQQAVSGLSKFMTSLSTKWGELFRYFLSFGSLYQAIDIIRTGVQTITSLDTAMVEVRKVSDETEASYSRFRETVRGMAGDVATTNAALMNSTADWLRTGYDLENSTELAKNSAMYVNVGDGINIDTATSDMVTAMKAFGITAEDSMRIVDVYNEVGNRFSISSSQIGEAMNRSSSALAVGNNSFEESVALATAMHEITQNAENTGNTLKVLSLRLRGSKVALEEAGESTEGMATSTSKLREQIKALTNIDGSGGFDIMKNDKEFKSTFEMIEGIAPAFQKMDDIDKAGLLELIAGKMRANNVAALLSNWEQLGAVMEATAESEGSAEKENEAIVNSIAGKMKILQASMENFWQSAISDDFIKGVIDGLTSLADGATEAVGSIGLLGTAFGLLAVGSAVGVVKNLDKIVGVTNYSVVIIIVPTPLLAVTRNEVYD